MPWDIKQNFGSCSGYAVVKRGTTEIEGCHSSRTAAQQQMAALYASETEKEIITSDNVPNRGPDWIGRKKRVKKDMDLYEMLTEEEKAFHDALVSIANNFGPFDQGSSSIWVGYKSAEENEDKEIGVKCSNCSFFVSESNGCMLLSYPVEPEAICRLAAIPDGLVNSDMEDDEDMSDDMMERIGKADNVRVGQMVSWNSSGGRAQGKVTRVIRNGKYNVPGSDFTITGTEDDPAVAIRLYRDGKPTDTMVGHKMSTLRVNKVAGSIDFSKLDVADIDLKPSESMANNARRGLELRREHGRGGTSVGVARARDLSNRKTLSPETVARMYSYFSRHEVDKKGKGWNAGEEGYPSNGRIAWLLWGGDAGYSWAKSKWSQIQRARMKKNEESDKKQAEKDLTSAFLSNMPREARRPGKNYTHVSFEGLTKEKK
jgi:hypothetical protein